MRVLGSKNKKAQKEVKNKQGDEAERSDEKGFSPVPLDSLALADRGRRPQAGVHGGMGANLGGKGLCSPSLAPTGPANFMGAVGTIGKIVRIEGQDRAANLATLGVVDEI